ncbi:hemerythrin family protein [Sulfurovum sp.]|uniref:bacteriohemerythrin n=1 Tax=Sulfurovum sp. TaxID=1969726 RepID=UPI00286812A1|nr:hemerythrin family protein [Sulfurovum sp.]
MALVYAEQVEYLDVEEMQETHEAEIKLLNEVDKLATQYMLDKSKLSPLEAKLDEYIAHVKEHFANEERLMQKYDFPSYDMHKTAHDMFLSDISSAIRQWKEFGNVDKVINFIYKSPEWIVLHINTVDTPTAAYIAKKMALEKE